MEDKKIFVIVFVVLLIALAGVGIYLSTQNSHNDVSNNTSDNNTNNTNSSKPIMIDKDGKNNNTVVGFNASKMGNNTTHRVYNPQTDSYVTVIGEGYDSEVNRWYTYDSDGVRYYNTRFK